MRKITCLLFALYTSIALDAAYGDATKFHIPDAAAFCKSEENPSESFYDCWNIVSKRPDGSPEVSFLDEICSHAHFRTDPMSESPSIIYRACIAGGTDSKRQLPKEP